MTAASLEAAVRKKGLWDGGYDFRSLVFHTPSGNRKFQESSKKFGGTGLRKRIERAAKKAIARILAVFIDKRRISAAEVAGMKISSLLVIRQHNQMGDMLLAVPAFRGIRRKFPEARIALVASPINAAVAMRIPYIDEVFVYDKRVFRSNPLALAKFISTLRKKRFDAAIVLNTVSFSITSMILAAVSGARVRVGSTSAPFGHDLSSLFYHLELPLPGAEELSSMHESLHNLYPLESIGVVEQDLSSKIVPTPQEELDAERFVTAAVGAKPFVVIHPGAGKKANLWPAERFAAVSRILGQRHGIETIAVRGPLDREAMDSFLKCTSSKPSVLINPDAGFLAAVMKRAKCTVCNDTGIMHIAGAVGACCVAVFGPTDPSRWKPTTESVSAVRAADCCIESVIVEDVVAEVERSIFG